MRYLEKQLSFLNRTPVGLAHYSKRQARRSDHPRSHQRPHHGIWNFHRKYAERGRDADAKSGVRKRQYHSENRSDIAFSYLHFTVCFYMLPA